MLLREPLARLASQYNMHRDDRSMCHMPVEQQRARFREVLERNLRKFGNHSIDVAPPGTHFPSLDADAKTVDLLKRSMYDHALKLYAGATNLTVLYFEDVITCSDRLFAYLDTLLVSDVTCARARVTCRCAARVGC
jgi:hypothetical protein